MKKIWIIFLLLVVTLLGALYYNYNVNQNIINKINLIEGHYNSYVITTSETNLYNDKYEIYGKVGNNVELELEDIEINEDTKYFKIKNTNFYIDYNAVKKIDVLTKESDSYKNYVPFNLNVKTENKTIFYNDFGLFYEINESVNLPVIIKDTDKYYVIYHDKLLYLKKDDVIVFENNNTNVKIRDNVRTFAFHFVYEKGVDECTNSYICHTIEQFDEYMKYLSDNDYFALSMQDLNLFLDGKIRIKDKSLVITFDDGYLAKNAIEILEKYQIHATYFLVTSWIDPTTLKSDYVELHSHSDNMHNNYKCPGGFQGGQMLCDSEENILKDLELSSDKLNGSKVFCFPFYDYNERAISLLKKAGYEMAFINISNTGGYSKIGTNKYMIPRLTMSSLDTLADFISYLK